MDISQAVVDFTTLAIQAGGYMELDRLYLQNRIIALIGEDSLDKVVFENQPESSLVLLDKLIAKAKENGVIDDSLAQKEILEAQLMDFLTPPPSVVNAFFAQHYAKQPEDATNYFFQLCQENDYIKTRAIAKNVVFPAETEYGNLEITINLSKPEKDPKEIAAMRSVATVNYPKCLSLIHI